MIAMEAENFTVAAGGEFVAGDWGHAPHRFAATIANTFMSRRSCLHAPANVSSASSASMSFSVTKAGSYNVLLRYESAYLFDSEGHYTSFHSDVRVTALAESSRLWQGSPRKSSNCRADRSVYTGEHVWQRASSDRWNASRMLVAIWCDRELGLGGFGGGS